MELLLSLTQTAHGFGIAHEQHIVAVMLHALPAGLQLLQMLL
jgi:hypothetical protein